MSSVGVNPEAVIARLSQQIGQLTAELAMHSVALEAAQARIAELDTELADRVADLAEFKASDGAEEPVAD